MIKRVFLCSVLCYFLIPILAGLIAWKHVEWAGVGYLSIGAVVVASVGLFVGVFLSAVFQNPTREIWFYLIGQILPVAGIIILFVVYTRPKEESNAESNEKYVFQLYRDFPAMGIAYDSLKTRFNTPDDFQIEFTASHGQDTLIHFYRDTLWTIHFAYALKKGAAKERYATYIVFEGVATMKEFNCSQSSPEFAPVLKDLKGAKTLLDKVNKE